MYNAICSVGCLKQVHVCLFSSTRVFVIDDLMCQRGWVREYLFDGVVPLTTDIINFRDILGIFSSQNIQQELMWDQIIHCSRAGPF